MKNYTFLVVVGALLVIAGCHIEKTAKELSSGICQNAEATGNYLQLNSVALLSKLPEAQTSDQQKLIPTGELNSVVNDETNVRVARLGDELLGEVNGVQLTKLRDTLSGTQTAVAVKGTADSAMMTIAYGIKPDVKNAVDESAFFIEKYAGRLLIILGVIALDVIIIFRRLKQKNQKTTTVLAPQDLLFPIEILLQYNLPHKRKNDRYRR